MTAFASLSDPANPFFSAVHDTRMPIVVTDPRLPDNPLVYVNDALCELTGYARHELIGRNCRLLQGPDSCKASIEQLNIALKKQRPVHIDILNYRKNGKPFWNRLQIGPVHDADGVLLYYFASMIDVYSQKERLDSLEGRNAALMAELGVRLRAQQDTEARLHFAAHAGNLGTWDLDLRSMMLASSRTCRDNMGCDPSQPMAYDDLLARIHADDLPRLNEAVSRTLTQQQDFNVECRVQRLDGTIGWVHIQAEAVPDNAGSVARLVGTSQNITQRKAAEYRRDMLMALDDALRHLDAPDDIAYASSQLLGTRLGVHRVGYGDIDIESETIVQASSWTAPDLPPLSGTIHFRDYGSFVDDLKRGEVVVFSDCDLDLRTAHKSAALKAVGARAVLNIPLTERHGLVAIVYLNCAVPRHWSDDEIALVKEMAERTRLIIERRRAEHNLKTLAASLETQVAQRTAQLMTAEASLRQSQKMEAVGQLTGGLAHDFNNLLTGVLGNLERLATKLANDPSHAGVVRHVEAAQDAARRAAALTHRLLAFSRRQTLEPRVTDVAALVDDMHDLIQRTVGPHIDLIHSAPPGLPNVMIDPNQLKNALLNLCLNARDAMPEGGTLTISTARIRATRERSMLIPGQTYVVLTVTDTGVGMSEDVMHRACEPFFTTKPLGQGTGLGLSMIYGFAQQSGGDVLIRSQEGKGTEVALALPATEALGEDPSPLEVAQEVPPLTDHRRVLVVDDEAVVRMLVVETLQDLGYAVLEADDGAQALRILQQTSVAIDLLVTDVGLPGGLNGRQVADAGQVLRPAMKVLFITGYVESAVFAQDQSDEVLQVLVKPFSMSDLSVRVGEMLNAPDAQTDGSTPDQST